MIEGINEDVELHNIYKHCLWMQGRTMITIITNKYKTQHWMNAWYNKLKDIKLTAKTYTE